MDCDSEFNALVSLYQSVMQDMKLTYPAWENVSQKALKLSNQLKGTVLCLNAFVDAVQSVGDAANNLKGATRDMGACLTRVCMRQRSIENRLRALADSLTDELVMTIQNKCAYWKQRVTEMDRRASKFCRKTISKARKGSIDSTSLNEQRRLCRSMLVEQRNQLSFFVSALIPVLTSELSVLDEGPHVRQVTDHLHQAARSLDSSSVVDTILEDIHQGSDYSWRSCISSNAGRAPYGYSGDDTSTRVSSPTPSTFTWPTAVEASPGPRSGGGFIGSHTISVVEPPKRAPVSAHIFSPPSPNLFLKKPPLPKRVGSTSSASSNIPDFSEPLPDQVQMPVAYQNGGSQYASSTSLSRDSTLRRPQRPSSFVYDESCGTLRILAPSKSKVRSNTDLDLLPPSTAAYESASLVAETLQQIDKLGTELDSYCNTTQGGTLRSHVRLRSVSSCKPPPPPERRSSTITAATPTAPSVAEIRAAGGNAPSEYASSVASSSELGRDPFSYRFP